MQEIVEEIRRISRRIDDRESSRLADLMERLQGMPATSRQEFQEEDFEED